MLWVTVQVHVCGTARDVIRRGLLRQNQVTYRPPIIHRGPSGILVEYRLDNKYHLNNSIDIFKPASVISDNERRRIASTC
jgi:hypothetical protein